MKNLVYTAMSKHFAYAKEAVCAHVFNSGAIPLNPFSMYGYFLYDLVDRNLIREANLRVIKSVDEVWVYGPIADGCLIEIKKAYEERKVVRYFSINNGLIISEIKKENLLFEEAELEEEFFEKFQ